MTHATVAPSVPTVAGFTARIARVDATKRLVLVIATSEAVDSFGTRFSYEASKDAFSRALGNVREMHQDIAVGSIVDWEADDEKREIRVWIYVSEGAQDTWLKVLDGTLKGASIGADQVRWERGQDGVLTAVAYNLIELSLVDNPSNPKARILEVRKRGTGMVAQARRGAIPANSITKGPTSKTNAIESMTPAATGKLIIATSSDPHAADYGVPPEVNIRATPNNSGRAGTLASTEVSGEFHEGGHSTQGASVGEGEDPMPETEGLTGYDVEHMSESEDAMDPTEVEYGRRTQQLAGRTIQPPAARRPAVAARAPARRAPQASSPVSPDAEPAGDDGDGDETMESARTRLHRAAGSGFEHVARVLDACGCDRCADLAAQARVLRDAAAADADDQDAAAMDEAPTALASRPSATRGAVPAPAHYQRQVAGLFAKVAQTLTSLTQRVEQIGAQPEPAGPYAMATRGWQTLDAGSRIATLQSFAQQSQDPTVQMEAAAAILRMQQD